MLGQFLFALVLSLSCGVASANGNTDHFVFLIHGLGGDIDSFGNMRQALTNHLNADSRLGRVQVMPFKYETSNDSLRTDDFAKQFHDFIESSVQRYGHAGSTLSVVAHSQGGLVTTVWYYKTYLGVKGFNPDLAARLKSVVTLGTPFWGSKVATWVERNPKVFKTLKSGLGSSLGPVGAIGLRQVLDMALGSENTQRFRRHLMNFKIEELEHIFSNVHVLNIHGNANLKQITTKVKQSDENGDALSWLKPDIFTKLLPFVFGEVEYEADGVVSVPASTLNTIYLTDLSPDYKDGQWYGRESFGELKIADRLIVKTVHASTEPEVLYDMAYIPSVCVSDSKCDHPTYPYVLEYILNETLDKSFEVGTQLPPVILGAGRLYGSPEVKLANFGGFTLDVNVRLPEGFEALRKDVKIYIHPDCLAAWSPSEKQKVPRVKINQMLEIYSHVRQIDEMFLDSVFNWYTGHVQFTHLPSENYDQKFREEGGVVKLSIVAPGMKTRNIEAHVRPTVSTYIDVLLAPK